MVTTTKKQDPKVAARNKRLAGERKYLAKLAQKYAKDGKPTKVFEAKSEVPKLTTIMLDRLEKKQGSGSLFYVDTIVPNQMLSGVLEAKDANDWIGAAGKGVEKTGSKHAIGWTKSGDFRHYKPMSNGHAWGGNQYTQVATVSKIGGAVDKVTGGLGKGMDAASIFVAYQKEGVDGAKKEAAKIAGGKVGSWVMNTITSPFCAAAGAVTVGIGGAVCVTASDRLGDKLGGDAAEKLYEDLAAHEEKWQKMPNEEKWKQIEEWAEPEIKRHNAEMEAFKKQYPTNQNVKIGE